MELSTKLIHTDFFRQDSHNALHMPIYNNVAFEFEDAGQMELAFLGKQPMHMYSRISNPTVEYFEHRVKAATEAQSVTALASGMAAVANVFLTIAESGNNIITTKHLFGNTISLFESTLNPLGVETRYCDLTNPSTVENAIDKNTIAIFFESITNPHLEVTDIEKISAIAKAQKILVIADTTVTPFNIFQAKKSGVNIEVISSTKIISGGGTSLGGLIIDHGSYDWNHSKKLQPLVKKFGPFAFSAKLKKEVSRNVGACLSPYNAFLQTLGLETLDLRFKKSASNALELAKFLEGSGLVSNVNYPGLKSSPFHEISIKQFGDLPCSILTFELGSKKQCFSFLNKLRIVRRATNLNDNKTLAIHPSSTIFCEYSNEAKEDLGISDHLIRLSAGIEDVKDIIGDINNALN